MSAETQAGLLLRVLLWIAVLASGALAIEPLSDGELDRTVAQGIQDSEAHPGSLTSLRNSELNRLFQEESAESSVADGSAEEDLQAAFTLIAESDLPPAVMSYITGARNSQTLTNRSVIRVRRRLPSLPLSVLRARGFVLPLFIR